MNAALSPSQGNNVKIIAGYALQQKLGSGSFATVYKGVKITKDDGDDSADTVAIKAITRMSDKITKKVLENLEMEVSNESAKLDTLLSDHLVGSDQDVAATDEPNLQLLCHFLIISASVESMN